MVEKSAPKQNQILQEPENNDYYKYSKTFGLIIIFDKYSNYREQNRANLLKDQEKLQKNVKALEQSNNISNLNEVLEENEKKLKQIEKQLAAKSDHQDLPETLDDLEAAKQGFSGLGIPDDNTTVLVNPDIQEIADAINTLILQSIVFKN